MVEHLKTKPIHNQTHSKHTNTGHVRFPTVIMFAIVENEPPVQPEEKQYDETTFNQ